MGGSPENEIIKKYSLRIGVGESVSLREIGLTDEALRTYITSSESEHVKVNSENYVITGLNKGEATVYLSYPLSGSPDKQPYAAIKVYVSESETYISPSLDMTDKLFLNTTDNSKTIKLIDNEICSLKDILNKWDSTYARKNAADQLGISEYEADLYFRLAALWQIPKMTKEFAYLAALTGIRNAHDLSKVNAHNLEEAFDLLKNNILIVHSDFEMPDHTEINEIIQIAKSLNSTISDYYDVDGGLPSMPSTLLDNDSFLKSDSEVINEGLKFLENINPALPLPKIISGCVMINETDNYNNSVPKGQGGLLVSISGISDPSQDKTENEKEYSCYTDPQGKFSIVMPDRYNMQETLTITVSKKNDMRYAVAGQSSSNKVQFVKRASEVLQNEYITMILTDEKGEPLKDESGNTQVKDYKASEIMTIINNIRAKNSKAMEIEKVLRKRAYNKYALKYKYIDAELAKSKLEGCKVVIERGVRYHIRKFYEQLEGLFASFDIYRDEIYDDDEFEEDDDDPGEEEDIDEDEDKNNEISRDSIIWQIDTVKAKPGEKVKLNIYVKDPHSRKLPVAGLQFGINSSDSLTLVSGRGGEAYSKDFTINEKEKLFVATTRGSSDKIASNNSVVATLEFTVPENCAEGTYPVDFERSGYFKAYSSNQMDISDKIVRVGGAVIVEKAKPFKLNIDSYILYPSQTVKIQVMPVKELLDQLLDAVISNYERRRKAIGSRAESNIRRRERSSQFSSTRRNNFIIKARQINTEVTYQWYKDSNIIEGATNNYYIADSEGNYYCKVKYPVYKDNTFLKSASFTTNTATVEAFESRNEVVEPGRVFEVYEPEPVTEVSDIVVGEISRSLEEIISNKLSEIKEILIELADHWNSLPQNSDYVYLYDLLEHEHIGNGFINGEDPYETIGQELFRFFEAILNDLYNIKSDLRDLINDNNPFFANLIETHQIELFQNNLGGYIDLPDCDLLYEKISDYKSAKAEYLEAAEEYERVRTDVEYSEKASEDDKWFEKYISGKTEDENDEKYTINEREINYVDDLYIDYPYPEPPQLPEISFSETVKEFIAKSPDAIEKEKEMIKSENDTDEKLISDYKELLNDCLEELKTIQKLENIIAYDSTKYEQTGNDKSDDNDNLQNPTSKLIERCILNFLSTPMDSRFPDGSFIINKSDFEDDPLHPRALPSVKLMGDGKNEIYLPTDTAPSRMFNYTMVHRLVEPKIKKNGKMIERQKLSGTLNIQKFKENLRENHKQIAMANSLGIGYSLNMHQAWVPDGFALGDLLYSLVLAPGEEQRIIVREHHEAYTVSDESNALDRIHDSYSNSQIDNETAAFTNAVDRFSNAHSDSSYYSKATSSGSASIGLSLFKGLHGSVSSTSTNSGSSSANSYQRDSYDEASHAAQSFQSMIKTESERISSANRTSISIATSDETESVSSRIIANHNHSHVMTVQYWEVARRYRLETCIDGVELLLFVPLEPISFMPRNGFGSKVAYGDYSDYSLKLNKNTVSNFTKSAFDYRYGNILKYYDIIERYVPFRYRSGLNFIKKFAAIPYWETEGISDENTKYTITIKGGFCEFDNLSATAYFNNGSNPIQGALKEFKTVKLELDELTEQGKKKKPHTRKEVIEAIISARNNTRTVKFTFTLPYGCSEDDISQISIRNDIKTWKYTLSQNTDDMEAWEKAALEKYEAFRTYYAEDNRWSSFDKAQMEHYAKNLPECYNYPIVTFSASELYNIGDLDIEVYESETIEPLSTGVLNSYSYNIYKNNTYPKLRLKDIQKIEETFHHIVSDTMYYSQVIWASLSDDERIILLEPYTIEFDDLDKIASPESKAINSGKSKTISLLNCVNAKNVIGFYGNCMMLPFTFPPELVELLGKTAGDIQDELYRHHACNFRVPSTVISVPTNGMVGEAVLGSTNVSEKIDITRFWNWKDSDIDHINIDQSSLNGRSLLENAHTTFVDAPTVGVTPTEHINGNNLVSSLVERQQPTFADVYTNTDMREVMKNADNNATAGRAQAMQAATDLTKAALDVAVKAGTAAATGGASLAAGGTGLSSLIGALGKAGLSDSDLGKIVKEGIGSNGSLDGVAKSIAGMIGSGDSDQMKKNLSSIGGEDLKKFLTKFVSNSSSEEYKKLEDNFTNSISGLVKNPGKIKTEDIINAAKKFCSENNIELSEVTGYLGSKLGLY